MGVFDTYADKPFQLNTEGQTMTLVFKQGVPNIGQGTISWNIPVPGADCNASLDGRQGAYAGIVVLASNTPLTPDNIPQNGQQYTADPTLNPDLHSGDRIGDALVVGAFYEADKLGRGEDLTTSLVVSDVRSDKPYYVGAYAVDPQFRYHSDGVRAYSDKYGDNNSKDHPSTHTINIGDSGVLPTDGTGLLPGATYLFDVLWDDSYPDRTNEKVYRISVDGSNSGTYQELLSEINKQFAKIENPPMSPDPPNTGSLYWDDDQNKLYVFDGQQLQLQSAIVQSTDPSAVTPDEYWYKPSTNQLYVSSASPISWSLVNIIDYGPVDPRDFKCTDYWFDLDQQGYLWNGSVWCEVPTIVNETDPSVASVLCGTYWFDNSDDGGLFKWNAETCSWELTSAITWAEAPNMLSTGTLWFDLDSSKLFERSASPSWIEIEQLVISTTQPIAPAIGLYWFSLTTEQLKQWNGTAWINKDVLVWDGDPADVTSCELWWRSTDDELFVWDVVNSVWIPVVQFIQSSTDPRTTPLIEPGTIWYKPSVGTIVRWDGAAWIDIDVVANPTDPTSFSNGDAWYNPTTNDWYIWNGTSPAMWNLTDVTTSENDPTSIPTGTFWFNTSNDTLYTRNGLSWITTGYVTSPPTPKKGQQWFNLSDNALYQWEGTKWIPALPLIFAGLTSGGNMQFVTRDAGGAMNLIVLTPGTPGELGTGFGEFGYQEISSTGRTPTPVFMVSDIPDNQFLFTNLMQGAQLSQHVYGADGVSDTPSYLELGVGTDGSPDERRELADSIRYELGYPTVTVELDKQQLDTAIRLALEEFRQKSSASYKRGFYFMDIVPGRQHYLLTNKQIGHNKIVNITGIYRFTSAFLSSTHGGGVYGQVVLQHLYNMGTYDLVSYHLVSQYVEQLEHLFATRLTYHWDEPSRELTLYTSFIYPERVLMDCFVERTEQDLLKDRLTKIWIRRWATAEAMLMLAQIRGKFGSLPGAGGGVTLNASELQARGDALKEMLLQDLDNYIAQDIEDVGMGSFMSIG